MLTVSGEQNESQYIISVKQISAGSILLWELKVTTLLNLGSLTEHKLIL